jgi:hypothetical protein
MFSSVPYTFASNRDGAGLKNEEEEYEMEIMSVPAVSGGM